MGSSILRFFIALVVLFIIGGRGLDCSPLDMITITQAPTGRLIEQKPEYEVMVSNNGKCPLSSVVVQCYGLSSVELIDSNAIRPVDGERCVVGEGRLMARGEPVRFKYAWMTPQDFPVVSAEAHC